VRESTDPLAMRVRGLFSPASLPGLAAWYDASDSATVLTTVSPNVPATDGQTVRRWLDKSGNNRHLDQATLVNQPKFVNAVLPAISSDGINDWLRVSGFTVAQPFAAAFAIDAISNAQRNVMDSDGGGGRCIIRARNAVNGNAILFAGSTLEAPIGLNGRQSLIGFFNGSASVIRVNGQLTTGAGGASSQSGLTIFADFTAGGPLESLAYDIIVWKPVNFAAESIRVEQYFYRKMGI
jgi:hypothetical protein